MINSTLVLISNSPRRRELLKNIAINIECQSFDFNENFIDNISLTNTALQIAKLKMKQFVSLNELEKNKIYITADTLVINKDNILGKPNCISQAKEMLYSLNNNKHIVSTGVCIQKDDENYSFNEMTKVQFSNLSTKDIDYYIQNFSPTDKAGAYGIQEYIGLIGIKKIEGCFYNVMGLPIWKLYDTLKKII